MKTKTYTGKMKKKSMWLFLGRTRIRNRAKMKLFRGMVQMVIFLFLNFYVHLSMRTHLVDTRLNKLTQLGTVSC